MASYDDDKRVCEKLKALLEEALAQDQQLRIKFKAGDKLNIVPQQLRSMLSEVEDNLAKIAAFNARKKKRANIVADDEAIVYVYLFNGNGKELYSWSSMMTKDALFGYSVNRPIYEKLEYIEKLLRERSPRENNAALAVIVKKSDILPFKETSFAKDLLDQPLIRIREGAFLLENVQYFLHNHKRYTVGERGKLTLMT